MTGWGDWTPSDLREHLRGIDRVWYIVGGWALDLWHGRQMRDHHDLEFCILRPDFDTFRAKLSPFQLHVAKNGTESKLPTSVPAPSDAVQFWGRDPHNNTWAFDMMIEEGSPRTWVYKRVPQLTSPREDMVHMTPDRITFLRPVAVLLFKAKKLRPKDQFDFDQANQKLSQDDVVWLKAALAQCHPGHPWNAQLSARKAAPYE